MSVRKFLGYFTSIFVGLVVATVAVLQGSAGNMREAMSTDQAFEKIGTKLLELQAVSNDAVHAEAAGLIVVWEEKIASLLAAIDGFPSIKEDDRVPRRLRSAVLELDREMRRFLGGNLSRTEIDQIPAEINAKLLKVSSLNNLVGQLSRDNVVESAEAAKLKIVTTLVFLSVLTLGSCLYLRSSLSRSVKSIDRALKRISEGEPNVKLPPVGLAELNILSYNFNQTLDKLHEITVSREELISEIEQRRNAEIEALKAVKQMRETHERLIHAEKLSALGTVVGGVAHEMNNPLMGVSNYIDFVESRLEDGELREVLNKAKRETDRMARIVRNMLVYTHSDPDGDAHCDVGEVVSRVFDILAARAHSEGASSEIDIGADLPEAAIRADLLQQVMMNIVTNALDAVVDSERKIVRVRAATEGGRIAIDIADSGPGIPGELRTKIFDPFFTSKPPGKGTGLGLSISEKILKDAGGALYIGETSELGGAEFRVTLTPAEHYSEA